MKPRFESGAGLGGWLGWASSGAGLAGLGGWATLKRKLVYSKMERCVSTEKIQLPDGQQQQAISIYFLLEGLRFGV